MVEADDENADVLGEAPVAEPETPAAPPPAAEQEAVTELQPEGAEAPTEEQIEEWRNFRISDHPGENLAAIRELAKKSVPFRRAMGTAAAEWGRAEYEPQLAREREEKVALQNELRAARIEMGDMKFGRALREDPDRLGAALMRNPKLKDEFEQWQRDRNTKPAEPVKAYVVNTANRIVGYIENAALAGVPQEIIDQAAAYAEQDNHWGPNGDPGGLEHYIKDSLDAWVAHVQNERNATKAPAAAAVTPPPAQATATRQEKPVPTGASNNIARLAPDASKRSGGTGSRPAPVSEDELNDMDPDAYERFLKAHGAKNFLDLRKVGAVKS